MLCSFHRGLGYTGVCISQNSANVHLGFVHFIVCKFPSEGKKGAHGVTHAHIDSQLGMWKEDSLAAAKADGTGGW